MKVLKKNQVLILVIALMLVTAGYLNFTSMNSKETQVASSINLADSADSSIGDATLVSNENVDVKVIETPNTIENDTDAKLVSAEDSKDYYFENSKLDRDKMYSQMLEAYQKMYEGETTPAEQKAMATSEIAKINTTRNAIMICENLIKTKGIKDLIIFVNDTQISVIVDEKELKPEQIAQIQNIISRELKADIVNIHISCK